MAEPDPPAEAWKPRGKMSQQGPLRTKLKPRTPFRHVVGQESRRGEVYDVLECGHRRPAIRTFYADPGVVHKCRRRHCLECAPLSPVLMYSGADLVLPPAPLREVVRRDGDQEYLECGHQVKIRYSLEMRPVPQDRRRCKKCQRLASNEKLRQVEEWNDLKKTLGQMPSEPT